MLVSIRRDFSLESSFLYVNLYLGCVRFIVDVHFDVLVSWKGIFFMGISDLGFTW